MNEIKKIHLGRQPFTISVDAHKLLRAYLEAIEHQVGAKSEVIKEVESRMAELLIERGITGDKVVLEDDVKFLKEQLGDPGDFKDDERAPETEPVQQSQKRLYRDPQNAMIAGVCSGLASYMGIDATIIRLLFVVALFFGGASILVYLVLWLVMPEANTPSERLQMQGKAVTVDSLKELVDRADVKGVADRAGKTVGPLFERLVQVATTAIGAGIIAMAVGLFIALTTAGSYMLFHQHDLIAQTVAFPVGRTETTFAIMCAAVAFILSLLGLLIGVAMVRRKWLVPGWITAGLIGLLMIVSAVGVATGPDAVFQVRDRYNAATHTSFQNVDKFNDVYIQGSDVEFVYEPSSSYQVGEEYVGKAHPGAVKTFIKNGTLNIDATGFKHDLCNHFCIGDGRYAKVIIRAPQLHQVAGDNGYQIMDVMPGFEDNTGRW